MTKEATPEHMIKQAKRLRQNQTDTEKLIWHLLHNRQIANAKFRRQHPIEGYVADFYCHKHKLIVELDGGQHFTEDGIRKDAQRTARLNVLGIHVLRFDNRQVLTEIEAVLQMIYERLTRPHPNPRPEGEGVRGAPSEIGIIRSSSPLPLGEDLGEGSLIKKIWWSWVMNTEWPIQTGPFGSQLHTSDYKETGILVVMPTNTALHKNGATSYTYYSMNQLSEHFKIFDGAGTVFGSINQKDFNAISLLKQPEKLIKEFEKNYPKIGRENSFGFRVNKCFVPTPRRPPPRTSLRRNQPHRCTKTPSPKGRVIGECS